MQAVDDNLCLSSLHDEYNILCSVSTPLCDADILFKIRLLVDLRHQCQASPSFNSPSFNSCVYWRPE